MTPMLLLVAGCATTGGGFPGDDALRPATGIPARFETPVPSDGTGACTNPLTDPQSGEQLRLLRSSGGRGDYHVSPGRYGARSGEVLRVDCRTWQAMGLVPA